MSKHYSLIAKAAALAVSTLLLFPAGLASATKAPPAKDFETLEGCVIVPDKRNDGDSFLVRLPDGREETFRLYFVDCPEAKSGLRDRSDEQAVYFGIDRPRALELGREAAAFTLNALSQPFTIWTRWHRVYGSDRFNAIINTSEGNDLNNLLVAHGLARIYGTRTPLPDGEDSRSYLARLTNDSKPIAQAAELGGWKR